MSCVPFVVGSGVSVLVMVSVGIPRIVVSSLSVTLPFSPVLFWKLTVAVLFSTVPLASAMLTLTVMFIVVAWPGAKVPMTNVLLPMVGAGVLEWKVIPAGYVSMTVTL